MNELSDTSDMENITTEAKVRGERGSEAKKPAAYWSPYLAGLGLGLTLLASLLIMGRGLGASGALTRVMGYGLNAVAPDHANSLVYLRGYFTQENHILNEYLVFLLAGVFVGGFVSGALAGRIGAKVERGPTASVRLRISLALLGGLLSGFGARLARGCTSGQALTGGSTLALGSWLFIIATFAGGYAAAYFVRRQWQ